MGKDFSHIANDGSISMVDVRYKAISQRVAIVRGFVHLAPTTLELLQQKALPKGDVLTTAKVAGILAAKRTAELIPLCHPLSLSFVDIRFVVRVEGTIVGIELECEARTVGPTGVEMEALVGAQVAAATIYDMCKAAQKDIIIDSMHLVYKSGGKSGEYSALDFHKEAYAFDGDDNEG